MATHRPLLPNPLQFLSLFIIFTSAVSSAASAAAAATSPPTADPSASFITSSCQATRYPAICTKSLSTYAATIQRSPRQLVTVALSVSIERAQSAKTFVHKLTKFKGLKPLEYGAIRDCLEEMSDGVDLLQKAAPELRLVGRARAPGPELEWHLSNLQTWVSAALTYDSTCMDGFSGRALDGRIKSSIRAWVTHVAQVTSNALALCNKFAGKE